MRIASPLAQAQSREDVVRATIDFLEGWDAEAFAAAFPGESLPTVRSSEDIEEWADRLQRQARLAPLLEPEETNRERLVRHFLLASVKLRQLQRVPARPRFQAIPGGVAA